MSRSEELDGLGLPVEFLNRYPLPTVIIGRKSPTQGHATHAVSGTPSIVELAVVWSNGQWDEIATGGNLLSTLDERSYHAVESWIISPHSATSSFVNLTFTPSLLTLRFARTDHTSPASSPTSSPASSPTSFPVPPATYHILTCLDDVSGGHQLLRQSTRSRHPSPTPISLGSRTPTPLAPLLEDVPAEEVTDCRQLLEMTDWSKTSLGPREKWSPVIETMISIIMRSPTQDSLWLGSEFIMIYNQHYSKIVHHPLMFGKSAKVKEAWGPVWDSVAALIDRCLTLGEPCHRVDDLLLYRRGPRGHFVEKYHTWSFVPIFDTDGKTPLGLFNPTVETTASVLAKRRQETLRDLSEQALLAKTQKEFWDDMPGVLELNPTDIPFVACYSLVEEKAGVALLNLVTKLGIPDGHPSTPSTISVNLRAENRPGHPRVRSTSSPSLSAISMMSNYSSRVIHSERRNQWPIAKALSTRQCVVMDDCTELVAGFPLRQWESLPDSAVVIPLLGSLASGSPTAVVVLGLNVQCPLDELYEEWILTLKAHLTASLASVKATEAEHLRVEENERMARAQTAWFQGAAHDLRSPLTLVAGPLDDLLRTQLTSGQRHMLTLAQRNVGRVQRLVTSLLDFSKIEAGRLKGNFIPIDLNRFVSDLAALFQPAAEKKGVTFRIKMEPHEGTVSVDPTLLETVVTNLLSNAVKYTQSGTVSVDVYYDSNVNIAILDTGCGIPKSELAFVFDRYHRATTALSSGVAGTGIGLALAQEIVKLHGGELQVESRTADEADGDHGTSFTVKIPLLDRESGSADAVLSTVGTYGRQVASEALLGNRSYDETASSPSANESATSESGDRYEGLFFEDKDVLLLADDSDDIREYIKRIFLPFCKVVEARDGEEALELAREHRPDLILSDLMMPNMNGQELLSAIKADHKTRSIPVILLSAATDEELRLSALIDHGAEDFLLKPFKPKELLARVNLHMQMGKRRIFLESQFAQREQELRIVSEYCPSGIIRCDANGHLIYVNPVWREYCGLAPNEDMNTWPDHVDDQTRERLFYLFEQARRGNKREMCITWKFLNGKTVSGTFINLDKIHPEMQGMVGCLQDITYQEERLFEAERRRIEAEEAKRQQEMLVDMTSHEIRTPVSAILQCSALVKENMESLRVKLRQRKRGGYIPDQAELEELDRDIEALDSIYQCGLVQERIANDILSLARVQLDTLSLHHVAVELRASARQSVSAFASEATSKRIKLDVEFGESLDRAKIQYIETDFVRLGQVVTNLIANAIKFTGQSVKREIRVRFDVSFLPPLDDDCVPADDTCSVQVGGPKAGVPVWLFVSVSDTGPGLSDEEQTKLFKRFSQGNEMIHSQYGGSGLGLFICRKITELMGGRIEVKSRLGRGSVFRFFIETRTAAPPDRVQKNVTGSSGEQAPQSPNNDLTAHHLPPSLVPAPQDHQSPLIAAKDGEESRVRTVLIVEDNIINQTVLKRQLSKAGWKCDVADDGQAALECLRARAKERAPPYDVILMDLEMPVMSGIACVKEIRLAENRGEIVYQLVIALTGNARQGQIDQALEAGMDDVVIKPYRFPELVKKMKGLIDIGREEIKNGRRGHGGQGVNRGHGDV